VEAQQTIAAVSTPPGRGGIGIVRISGKGVRDMASAVLGGLPEPRRAHLCAFRDHGGEVIDRGIALFFPAPGSYTGEDVLELQAHGGPVVLDVLLRRCLSVGARLARPGEFSERAFLNGRMDLAQAEAVADLIDSASEQAARSALRSLEGALSTRVHNLVQSLADLRAHVEAAMDFPEEEIDFLSDAALVDGLARLSADLQATLAGATQGCLLNEGVRIVLAGLPNVGKSSLLNLLAGRASAIVTDIPGTTRDPIREYIHLDGLPLHVVDTAGIRDAGDVVEQQGVERAWQAIHGADALLLVVDDRSPLGESEEDILSRTPNGVARVVVHNKIDLSGRASALKREGGRVQVFLSAKTGGGLEELKAALKECVGYRPENEGAFMARRRHLDALERAAGAMDAAGKALTEIRAGELVAEELRQAQLALGEISGEFTSEDLLERIFASFCIGK
jgi:tRNA modification GTPase